jgi:hypothetical protein
MNGLMATREVVILWVVTPPRTLFRKFFALCSAKLGRCPRCMRLSLRGALLGWIALTALHLFWPKSHFWYLGVWALGFTFLWLLHVGAFAVRSVAAARRVEHDQALRRPGDEGAVRAPIIGSKFSAHTMSRREIFDIFVENAGLAMAASLSIALTDLTPMAGCIGQGDPCAPGGAPCCSGKLSCCGSPATCRQC